MLVSQQNHRVLLLLAFLVIVLIAFLFINQKVKSGREDLTRKTTTKIDLSYLCMNGSQSDRSRNCPKLIRGGTFVSSQLRLKCEQDDSFKTDYNNKFYSCGDQEELSVEVNKYIRAMRK